jgi:hypothetical protein
MLVQCCRRHNNPNEIYKASQIAAMSSSFHGLQKIAHAVQPSCVQIHSTVSFGQGRDLAEENDVELGWLSFSLRCFDAQSRPDEVSLTSYFQSSLCLQCPGITLTLPAFGQLLTVCYCLPIHRVEEWMVVCTSAGTRALSPRIRR